MVEHTKTKVNPLFLVLAITIVFELAFVFASPISLNSLKINTNSNWQFDSPNLITVSPLDINKNIIHPVEFDINLIGVKNYQKQIFLNPDYSYSAKITIPQNNSISKIKMNITINNNGKIINQIKEVSISKNISIRENIINSYDLFSSYFKENIEYFFIGVLMFALGGLIVILNKK